MTELKDIVALSGLRTPIGRFGGTFKEVNVFELGAVAISSAIQRAHILPNQITEVVMGNCRQAGNGPNPARSAALLAGVPKEVPSSTLNMACPSGMKAIINASQSVMCSPNDVIIAGGMDSMSTIPHMVRGLRFNPVKLGDISIEDGWKDATDPIADTTMGKTAQVLADEYNITREMQDHYALSSHKKAIHAQANQLFSNELTKVELSPAFKHGSILLEKDETPRDNTSLERLGKLPPAFSKTGTVTAGNSSTMSDGACALTIAHRDFAKATNISPLFSIVAFAQCAVDGKTMGEGPTASIPMVLKNAGMTINDIDLFEINEAFASQMLSNIQTLKIDETTLNVHGGAIALGHPTGISGARIVITLAHSLQTYDKEFGLGAICGAGGVTTAIIIKRES